MKFTTGKKIRAQRVVIYGPESTGKTTLAAQMPNPVFLDTEDGSAHVDVCRAEIKTWGDMTAGIAAIQNGDIKASTVIVDTVDWAEKMLTEEICKKAKKDGLEDFGYGKGYTFLGESFSKFLRSLDGLIEKGSTVCVLAHSTVKRFEAPDGAQPYDRYELKLSRQVSPLLKEWCDALLFLNWDTRIKQSETGKGKAVGGKERILHTVHSAAWDAKNRHGLPDSIKAEISELAPIFAAGESVPTAEAIQCEPTPEAEAPAKFVWYSAIEDQLCTAEFEINNFLAEKGLITSTSEQTWRDIDNGAWRGRILANPQGLIEAATKGGK
jgi:hypothetical protein